MDARDSFDDFAPIDDDEDAEGGWGDEAEDENEPAEESKVPLSTYEVITVEAVKEMMEQSVSSIAETTNMAKEACMHLLRSFRWDEEKLTTEFLEKGKLLLKDYNIDLILTEAKNPAAASLECKICFEDTPIKECFSLGCNHWFCRVCWKDYLVDRVDTTGTRCPQSHCPMFKCKARIPDSVFSQFLDKGRVQKYEHSVLNAYVSEKKTLRWCPAPRCGKIISASGLVTSVRCICGQSFCFRCNEEAHLPVTCEQVQKWHAKCDKESETAQWIISNTKKCPKCLVRIEKNQGCNHMTCQFCKYEFCWVCMGPWADHGNHTGGFYKCNKYNPHKAKVKDESKAELDRFLHYYQRYHNHDQARKFAKEQIETSEKRMAELHTQGNNSDSQWQNVQFLQKSTMQVLECRRVLKYTYVYGYYCTDAKERELFEFLQEDLEKATEKLSELSEQPLEKIKRQEVVDFTMFTEKFLRNLLSGLEDGLTNERR